MLEITTPDLDKLLKKGAEAHEERWTSTFPLSLNLVRPIFYYAIEQLVKYETTDFQAMF